MMKSIAVTVVNLLALAVPASAQVTEPSAMAASPIKGVRIVGITVSDIDATIAFYSKSIPYEVVERYTVKASQFPKALLSRSHSKVDIAIVKTPTVFLQLMDFEPGQAASAKPRPVIGPGYTHICFQSHATNSAYDKFRKNGLNMVSRGDKAVDLGGYGVLYAYGRDPDGIMIENEVLSFQRRSEPAWLRHVANVVHDIDTMVEFYSRILTYGPRRRTGPTGNKRLDDIAGIDNVSIKGAWFDTPNFELEFWHFAQPLTPQPSIDRKLDEIGYSVVGFEVADLQSERQRLKKLSVRTAGATHKMKGWSSQYYYDPEGNLFALQQNTGAAVSQSILSLK
jgi:catechol 2,3-dioxygenase-like lactoylglutathione lyase family enzyme